VAGRGDVRAGRAFVELGTDESKLLRGLAAAMRRVRAFAAEAGAIGSRVALFGSTVLTGLGLLGKSFADRGEELAKLRDRTGLSAEALSGLARAAQDNDVPLQTVAKGITALQKRMSEGGGEFQESLEELGATVDDIKSKSPAEIFTGLLASVPRAARGLALIEAAFERAGAGMDRLRSGPATEALALVAARLPQIRSEIESGGADVAEALSRIGVSIEDVRRLRPGEVLALVSSGLPRVRRDLDRASQQLEERFGRIGLTLSEARAMKPVDLSKLVGERLPDLASSGSEFDRALSQIGVTVDELRRMRPDEVLALIADRLPRIQNEADRTAAAMALLGKSGAEMLAVFSGAPANLSETEVFGSLQGAVSSLQAALERGGPEVERALAGIGLRLEDLRGRGVGEAFDVVLDRLPKVQDEAQRTGAALALLGRGGAPIIDVGQVGEIGKVDTRPLSALRAAMAATQKAIAAGGPEVARAVASLGTSIEELAALRPDQALGLIGDRLPRVRDGAERTAMTLLGDGGEAMIRSVTGGAAALNQAADAARRSGDALDDDALTAAKRLDDAFDVLAGSTRGLRNEVAVALVPSLVMLANGVSALLQNLRAWTKENPEAVRGVLGLTLGVTGLGVATWGLAKAVAVLTAAYTALLSPVGLLVAPTVAVVVGLLAMTDALGITRTGFGDLLNTIRVGGQGLATQFGKLLTFLLVGWETLGTVVGAIWDELATNALNAGSLIYAGLAWVPRKLLEGFRTLLVGVGAIIEQLATAWNETVGSISTDLKVGKVDTAGIDKVIKLLKVEQEQALGNARQRTVGRASRQVERFTRLDDLISRTTEFREMLDRNDPDDGTALGFNFDSAKRGLVTIGNNVLDAVRDLLGGLDLELPADSGKGAASVEAGGTDTTRPEAESAFRLDPSRDLSSISEGVAAADESARRIDSVTTFNAVFADRLGIGSTIDERTVRASEETARNTRTLIEKLDQNAAGLAYGA
jgi:hypothetical protein